MLKITFKGNLTSIIVVALMIFANNGIAIANPAPKGDNSNHDSCQTIAIKVADIDRIDSMLKPKSRNILSEYGTVLVAIVALAGTVLVSSMGNCKFRVY